VSPRGDADANGAQKRTMASVIVAAIALERVTGRTADPGRLADAMD
jgi:hypothetical protein